MSVALLSVGYEKTQAVLFAALTGLVIMMILDAVIGWRLVHRAVQLWAFHFWERVREFEPCSSQASAQPPSTARSAQSNLSANPDSGMPDNRRHRRP